MEVLTVQLLIAGSVLLQCALSIADNCLLYSPTTEISKLCLFSFDSQHGMSRSEFANEVAEPLVL